MSFNGEMSPLDFSHLPDDPDLLHWMPGATSFPSVSFLFEGVPHTGHQGEGWELETWEK